MVRLVTLLSKSAYDLREVLKDEVEMKLMTSQWFGNTKDITGAFYEILDISIHAHTVWQT